MDLRVLHPPRFAFWLKDRANGIINFQDSGDLELEQVIVQLLLLVLLVVLDTQSQAANWLPLLTTLESLISSQAQCLQYIYF